MYFFTEFVVKLIDIFELPSGLHQAKVLTYQCVPIVNAYAIHKILFDSEMLGWLSVPVVDLILFGVSEFMVFFSKCNVA